MLVTESEKHEKTQHAVVGLGSAAVVAAVALPRQRGPNFLKLIKCKLKNKHTKNKQTVLVLLPKILPVGLSH